MPPPPKSPEKSDSKTDSESNSHSGKKESRLWIPAGIGNDRITVHEPRIVLGHINNFGIGRFNHDGVALSRYFLLLIAFQVSILVSLLAQRLNSISHILLLVGVGVA